MIGPDGGLELNVKRDRRNKNRKKLFMQEFFIMHAQTRTCDEVLVVSHITCVCTLFNAFI